MEQATCNLNYQYAITGLWYIESQGNTLKDFADPDHPHFRRVPKRLRHVQNQERESRGERRYDM